MPEKMLFSNNKRKKHPRSMSGGACTRIAKISQQQFHSLDTYLNKFNREENLSLLVATHKKKL